MYNELQSIYIQNKDLYRNPLKNQTAFNRANALANEMRALAARSKHYEQVFSDAVKSGREKYTPQSMQKLQMYMGLSSDDIFVANGNRDLSVFDFEFTPDEINPEEFRKRTQAMAVSRGSVIKQEGYYKHTDDPNRIPIGQLKIVEKEVIDDMGVAGIAQDMLGHDKYARRLKYEWDQLDVETQNNIRVQSSKIPGINLRDGAMMLAANMVKDNAVIKEKENWATDIEWKQQQDDKRKAEDRAFEMKKLSIAEAGKNARAASVKKAIDENNNVKGVMEAQKALRLAPSAGNRVEYDDHIAVAETVAAYIPSEKRRIFHPSRYTSVEAFEKDVNDFQSEREIKDGKKVVGGAKPHSVDVKVNSANIRKAYKNKTPIVGILSNKDETDPTKPFNQKIFMLDPYGDGAHIKAWENILQVMGSPRKQGPYFGYTEE
jgi:hypothetical protein